MHKAQVRFTQSVLAASVPAACPCFLRRSDLWFLWDLPNSSQGGYLSKFQCRVVPSCCMLLPFLDTSVLTSSRLWPCYLLFCDSSSGYVFFTCFLWLFFRMFSSRVFCDSSSVYVLLTCFPPAPGLRHLTQAYWVENDDIRRHFKWTNKQTKSPKYQKTQNNNKIPQTKKSPQKFCYFLNMRCSVNFWSIFYFPYFSIALVLPIWG